MTKAELREGLLKGIHLSVLLPLTDGQECMIFKAEQFTTDDQVIYIPDISLNEIPDSLDLSVDNSMRDASKGKWGSMTASEQIDLILSYCYTGADFVSLFDGDEALAYMLFLYCDWQHPSSAMEEVDYENEDDKKWAAELYAAYLERIGGNG